MRAIDTNVVVRFLTGDHRNQAALARKLIENHDVFVATTVLLETEWVLRGAYGLDRAAIIAALTRLAGLPRVTLQDPARIAKALTWAAAGVDFADAVHLAAAEACEAFVTFDGDLIKAAAGVDGPPVRAPK
jgi:predicted nucleic-acid-binding protein